MDLKIEFLLFLILNTWTSSERARTANAMVWPIWIFSCAVAPSVPSPKTKAAKVISPIIIPWYIILKVIPFVNIPLEFLSGFLFIIPFSAGSTAKANAGNESVTKLIHNICTGNNGSKAPISSAGIPKAPAKTGVKRIAINKTTISPTLLESKNWIAFKILS